MAITFEEAYAATDPNAAEEQRTQSANLLVLGSRANDVYWNSRSELEALKAQAEGHGQLVPPSESDTPADAEVVEGSATDEAPALAPGDPAPSGTASPSSAADLSSLTDDQLNAELERRGHKVA